MLYNLCAFISDDVAYERSDRLWERLMNNVDSCETTMTMSAPECFKLALKAQTKAPAVNRIKIGKVNRKED